MGVSHATGQLNGNSWAAAKIAKGWEVYMYPMEQNLINKPGNYLPRTGNLLRKTPSLPPCRLGFGIHAKDTSSTDRPWGVISGGRAVTKPGDRSFLERVAQDALFNPYH